MDNESEFTVRYYEKKPLKVRAVRWKLGVGSPDSSLQIGYEGDNWWVDGGDKFAEIIKEGDWIVIDEDKWPKGKVMSDEKFREYYKVE